MLKKNPQRVAARKRARKRDNPAVGAFWLPKQPARAEHVLREEFQRQGGWWLGWPVMGFQEFVLRPDLQRKGVEPDLVAAALGGRGREEHSIEHSVDALSLHLLECLAARDRLPKDGPGHIEKRRNAISDATVNYLIATMLEWLALNGARFPISLFMLIRRQLCGPNPDLHQAYLSRTKRIWTAMEVGGKLQPGEKLSVNKLAKMTGAPRATAARWLATGGFEAWANEGRLLARIEASEQASERRTRPHRKASQRDRRREPRRSLARQ
jgi:hypothetical protein